MKTIKRECYLYTMTGVFEATEYPHPTNENSVVIISKDNAYRIPVLKSWANHKFETALPDKPTFYAC